MAEKQDITLREEMPKTAPDIFSFFPKLKLKLPFFKQESQPGIHQVKSDSEAVSVAGNGGEEGREKKPDIVRFPKADLVVPPPLETEAEASGKTSNPVVLWQVYALGGFLVLRWVLARWKERRARKGNGSNNDDQLADDE